MTKYTVTGIREQHTHCECIINTYQLCELRTHGIIIICDVKCQSEGNKLHKQQRLTTGKGM